MQCCSAAMLPLISPLHKIRMAHCLGCCLQVMLGREDLAASLQQALSQLQADQQVYLRLSLVPLPKPSSCVMTGCWLATDLGPCYLMDCKPHQTIVGLQLVSWPGCRVVMPIPLLAGGSGAHRTAPASTAGGGRAAGGKGRRQAPSHRGRPVEVGHAAACRAGRCRWFIELMYAGSRLADADQSAPYTFLIDQSRRRILLTTPRPHHHLLFFCLPNVSGVAACWHNVCNCTSLYAGARAICSCTLQAMQHRCQELVSLLKCVGSIIGVLVSLGK